MKYIFLDIDGVLNSDDWRHRYINEQLMYKPEIDMDLDPESIQRINRILDSVDNVEIIISSSWRLDMYGTCKRLFNSGLKVKPTRKIEGFEFFNSGDSPTRGDLIEDFIRKNPCEKYVIFDDDEDMTDNQQPYFIKTSYAKGITDKDVEKAIEILNS